MKINKIRIRNFKGFEDRHFSFNDRFTVLIGDNGAGKSTVLDALAFSLGTFFLGVDGVSTYAIKQTDKRRLFVSPNSYEIQVPFRIDVDHVLEGKSYRWFRDTDKASGGSTSYKDAGELIGRARQLTDAVRSGEAVNLPIIAYYGVGRVASSLYEKNSHRKQTSRFEGYKGALDPRTMQQKALSWFKSSQESVLQDIQDESNETDKGLHSAFVEVLSQMIDGWTSIQYNLKREDVVGQFSDGSWKHLKFLSSGYQAIAALVMDIAYRAIKLNPHLGERAVLDTSGVVLIDEIDMYLHPKWQRRIVGDLKKTFPNIQFIVTTHSPFIVQSLKANEVINLDGNVDEMSDEDPINKSIEEVVEDEMGLHQELRSQTFLEYQEVAAKYFDLIEQGKDSTSDEETAKLKSQLDDLELKFSNDPVYLALMQAERKSGLKE